HEELPQYEQDPETATALVDDSMYSGEELVFAVRESIVDGDVIAATLQSSFSEIGVETDVRLLDDSSFQDFVREG
ncbi:hypothetical protein ACL00X_20660, partial [Aeromonas diversa]|uniref:hypothetical protein n=1 Tax=Aeromonas diversa TaxID=502790 RepID=UPI0039A1BEBF